jgi:hypothetical protein
MEEIDFSQIYNKFQQLSLKVEEQLKKIRKAKKA